MAKTTTAKPKTSQKDAAKKEDASPPAQGLKRSTSLSTVSTESNARSPERTPPSKPARVSIVSSFRHAAPNNDATDVKPISRSKGVMKNALWVARTRDNLAIVALPKNAQGDRPAFCKPLIDFLRDPVNEDFVMNSLNVHHVTNMVSAENPKYHRTFDPTFQSKSNFKPMQPIILCFMEPGKEHLNTPAAREKFALNICNVNNSAHIQSHNLYGKFPGEQNEMVFGGDMSAPPNKRGPPLSDFLTIIDCMNILSKLYKDPATLMEKPHADIAADDDLLQLHFSPEKISIVKHDYLPNNDERASDEKPQMIGVDLLPIFDNND